MDDERRPPQPTRRRDRGEDAPPSVKRRRLLGLSVSVGLGVAGASSLAAAVRLVPRITITPAQAPPAAGDLLVVAQGPRVGQVLTPEDVPVDARPVFAWPMDADSKVVKSGDTHNLILLVRAAARAWYGPREASYTAMNVAAYSAICTHLCCTVSEWRAGAAGGGGRGALHCPCHLSDFDPWAAARVVGGPAPRALPALPVATDRQGRLVVASGFLTQVGCAT